MGAIMLKYVQLLCVAFFMKKSNCSTSMSRSEQENSLKIGACIAQCMLLKKSSLEICYYDCSNTTETLMNINLSYIQQENGSEFDLYCRDSSNLVIKVNHQPKNEEKSIYILVVQESTGKFLDRLVYFSEDDLIEVPVDGLTTNELSTLSYNVSAFIVSSSASIQSLGMRKYTSMMNNYVPSIKKS